MGTRIKNFEATGIAPNGRLYAGDLNQIQDDYADLSNFTQTLDVGTLRVGDTSIQLLKYGTAEARLSSALRTDGITRSLGGLYAGAFTTAQRDAIAAGFRPYGLIILNTTLNRLEFNAGTDAVPNWLGLGAGAGQSEISSGFGLLPAGAFVPFGGTSAPTGYLMCDGLSYPVASYQKLWDAIQYAWGGSGLNFNVPNMKGMMPVGRDPADTGLLEFQGAVGTGGGEKRTQLDQAEMPNHQHTVASHSHGGGSHRHVGGNHAHGGGNHGHTLHDPGHGHNPSAYQFAAVGGTHGAGPTSSFNSVPAAITIVANTTGIWMDASGNIITAEAPGTGDPTDSAYNPKTVITAESPNTDFRPTPGSPANAKGASHNNLQPYKLCNYIIKT